MALFRMGQPDTCRHSVMDYIRMARGAWRELLGGIDPGIVHDIHSGTVCGVLTAVCRSVIRTHIIARGGSVHSGMCRRSIQMRVKTQEFTNRKEIRDDHSKHHVLCEPDRGG